MKFNCLMQKYWVRQFALSRLCDNSSGREELGQDGLLEDSKMYEIQIIVVKV